MSSLNYGISKSLPHFWGICFGFALMLLCIGFGLAEIFTKFPILHTIIKFSGALYILYLSWKVASSSTKLPLLQIKKPISMIEAMLFQWANPKAWVMAIGVFATFSKTTLNQSIFSQVISITAVFFIITVPCIAVWLIGGIVLKSILKNEQHLKIFNISMGLLLAMSVILIFI